MQQAEIDLQVMRAQMGSKQAFAWLFEHLNPVAVRFAYRVGSDPELARDAAQEAWLEVSRSLRRLQDPRAFRAWLLRLVRWRVLDQLRRNRKHSQDRANVETNELPDPKNAPEPSSLIAQIDRLPELERQVIHLYYLEQLSIAEVAAVIQVPAGTIKSRLYRAREHLKSILEADSSAPSNEENNDEN